jgi:hypothetical protein
LLTHKFMLRVFSFCRIPALLFSTLLLTACGAHYGAAKIVSFPPGAEVINLDDGTVIGNTPVTMRWKDGNGNRQQIAVRVRHPGYYEKVMPFWLSMRHRSEKAALSNPQLVEITMQKIGGE